MTDKLVFSQDGNQRALGQWTFYLYDKFLRLTVAGVCNNANTASASSSTVTCTYVTSNGGLGNSGYFSSFVLTTPIIHQVNYYDNYDFRSLTGFTNISYFLLLWLMLKVVKLVVLSLSWEVERNFIQLIIMI